MRGTRDYPVEEAIYRAAGCIEHDVQVQPGAVKHFWAQYRGSSFAESMVNIASVLGHLILIQSDNLNLIQGFGNGDFLDSVNFYIYCVGFE